MPTRCNRCFFIAYLIASSTCFGHHCAHHQELESIIQMVATCGLWCLVFKLSTPYRQLEFQALKTTGGNQLYNTLELLMMGIMVPETCWASNKISNKKHLLHLVGILFPHSTDFSYVRCVSHTHLLYAAEFRFRQTKRLEHRQYS
jgi:hypothetical protein